MRDLPARTPLVSMGGTITPEWQRWLTDLVASVDEIRRQPYENHGSGTSSLTVADLGRVHYFDIGTEDATVYLPAVDGTDLFKWCTFVRLGTGQLLIRAAESDLIEYSSAPGRIWCNEAKRSAANLTLQLVGLGKWGIRSGTGIWKIA